MLVLHNSLSNQKEEFIPIDKNHVKFYSCGPTVYNRIHIGNARAFISADLLSKTLKGIYPKVTYVSNITDIDDKIIAAAKDEKTSIKDISNKYFKIYSDDIELLGITKPDIQPFATDYIAEMVKYIEKLIKSENAYVVDGNVLFKVDTFSNYGCLSGRKIDEQEQGKRVSIESYKQNENDFTLWKPSNNDEPGWDSPWGNGRPGWHLECSVMSEENLGVPFDIHGGGNDLKFPHHENELAQTCAYHCSNDPKTFANYWFHNGFLNLENEKMSKSIGNVIYIDELLKTYEGNQVRLALLSTHYRQPIPWSNTLLEQAKSISKKLTTFFDAFSVTAKFIQNSKIGAAILDDLNTPKAISLMQGFTKDVPENIKDEISTFKYIFEGSKHKNIVSDEIKNKIEALIDQRDKARMNSDYKLADQIRDKLVKMNVTLKDVDGKTEWEI
ncbi:MAG: cysteine--tRNA ligase [Gammaproteobacteria bacterium]|nr:cysteine--tRNA ligase [Gammaproteobacteria bacterium]